MTKKMHLGKRHAVGATVVGGLVVLAIVLWPRPSKTPAPPENHPRIVISPPETLLLTLTLRGSDELALLKSAAPAGLSSSMLPSTVGALVDRIAPDLVGISSRIEPNATLHAVAATEGEAVLWVFATRVRTDSHPERPLGSLFNLRDGGPTGSKWISDTAILAGDIVLFSPEKEALEKLSPFALYRAMGGETLDGLHVELTQTAGAFAAPLVEGVLDQFFRGLRASAAAAREDHAVPPHYGDPEAAVEWAREMVFDWPVFLRDVETADVRVRAEDGALAIQTKFEFGGESRLAQRLIPTTSNVIQVPERSLGNVLGSEGTMFAPSISDSRTNFFSRVVGARVSDEERRALFDVWSRLFSDSLRVIAIEENAEIFEVALARRGEVDEGALKTALRSRFIKETLEDFLDCDAGISLSDPVETEFSKNFRLCTTENGARQWRFGRSSLAGASAIGLQRIPAERRSLVEPPPHTESVCLARISRIFPGSSTHWVGSFSPMRLGRLYHSDAGSAVESAVDDTIVAAARRDAVGSVTTTLCIPGTSIGALASTAGDLL